MTLGNHSFKIDNHALASSAIEHPKSQVASGKAHTSSGSMSTPYISK